MARIVKRKKRKIDMYGFSIVLFIVSLIFWLIASLFVKTRNDSLTIKIQNMTEELEMLRGENQSLNYEIQTLVNKDRIYELAAAADLDQVSDNIISIVTGD